jgi:hypothetical protein
VLSAQLQLNGPQTPVVGDNRDMRLVDNAPGTNNGGDPGSETAMAIDPTNPLHVVGFTHDYTAGGNPMQVFYSLDGGLTWSHISIDATFDGINNAVNRYDPTLKFDANGTLYLAYGVDDGNGVTLESIHGSFQQGTLALSRAVFVDFADDINPIIGGAQPGLDKWELATGLDPSTNGQAVYLAYTHYYSVGIGRFSYVQNEIFVTGSHDGGRTWLNHDSIHTVKSSQSFACPAVGPDGELYLIWEEFGLTGGSIHFARNLQGLWAGGDGLDVLEDIQGFQTNLYQAGVPPQPHRGIDNGPVLAVDNSNGPFRGRLYVVWVDTVAGCGGCGNTPSDIWIATSDHHGDEGSWAPSGITGNLVDGGNGNDFLPWLDVDPGTGSVDVMFYSNNAHIFTNPKLADVVVASSNDGGATFNETDLSSASSNASALTGNSELNDFGDYSGLAVYDGTIHGFWADNRQDNQGNFGADDIPYTAAATLRSATGNNTLVVRGDLPMHNRIELERDGANPGFIDVYVVGALQFSGLAASINNISIDGGAGDDNIVTIWGLPAGLAVTVTDAGRVDIGGVDAGSSVTVDLPGGAGTVNVDHLQDVQGQVTVNGGAAATLNMFDDNGRPSGDAYVLDQPSQGVYEVRRDGVSAVRYSGLQAVNLYGSISGTATQLSWQDTYEVDDTQPGAVTTLITGYGVSDLTILGTTGALDIAANDQGQPTHLAIQIADPGTAQSILGTVTLLHQGAYTADLTVDDSLDGAAYPGVTLSGTALTGLAPADIDFPQGILSSFTLDAGTGPVAIDLGSGSLDPLPGLITVRGNATSTQLAIDDRSDQGTRTYGIDGSTVSRSGTPVVHYSGLSDLILDGGAGPDTINIEGTSATDATQVHAGTSTGAIYICPVSENLDGIGHLQLYGSGAALTVNDRGANSPFVTPGSTNYSIDAGTISRVATYLTFTTGQILSTTLTATIDYSGMSSLTLDAGRRRNTIDVTGITPPTTINAGPAGDTIDVGPSLDPIGFPLPSGPNAFTAFGTLNVNANGGTLILDDRGTQDIDEGLPAPGDPPTTNLTYSQVAYTVNAGQVDRTTRSVETTTYAPSPGETPPGGRRYTTVRQLFNYSATINYTGASRLVLDGSPVGAGVLINVQSTAAGTATTVNVTGSGATVNLSTGNLDALAGPVTLNGSGAGTVVTLNDQAATASQRYVLAASSFSRANFGGLTYGGLGSLTIDAAPDNNSGSPQPIYVLGTPAGMATTINAASGWHNIVVGMPNGNELGVPGAPLDNILGPVTVVGQGYLDNLNLYDSVSTAQKTYNLNATSIGVSAVNGVTPGLISWQGYLSTVVLFGSTAADTYLLQGMQSDLAAMVVDGAWRANTFRSNVADRHTWLIYSNEAVATVASPGHSVIFGAVWNLTGGPGGDDFQFQPNYGRDGALNGVLGGNGGTLDYSQYAGASTVNLANGSATNLDGGQPGGFANIRSVIGNNRNTSLVGPDVTDLWTITGPNQGTLAPASNRAGRVAFSQVPDLTGGAAADTFAFQAAGSLSGALIDPGGNNTLDLSAQTGALTWNILSNYGGTVPGVVYAFAGCQNLVGGQNSDRFVFSQGTGVNTIDGGPGNNTLDLSHYTIGPQVIGILQPNGGYVSGEIATFQRIQNLVTGPTDDTFAFRGTAHLDGTIDGGGGRNTVNYLESAAGVSVNLQTDAASYVNLRGGAVPQPGGLVNIENLVGGPGAANTLVGADMPNTWTITGPNSGTVNGVSFAGFQGLTGGASSDVFRTRSGGGLSGRLDGGVGTNTLDDSAYVGNIMVDLPLGTATGVAGGIRNISNVIGGAAGNDILVGNGTGNRLTGGQGRNLLIAGPGAGTLVGGPDSDVLIGGATPYDTNIAALDAVMAEWGRTDLSYNARVQHLLSGGGLNGGVVLNAANVRFNAGGNTLDGGPGPDLFYGQLPGDGPNPDTTDWNPAQGEIFIEPNRERLGVQIDPTGLSASHLVLDNSQTISTSAPAWLTLQPGTHVLADAAGTGAVVFTLNPNGTVSYAPALQGILTGQGTSQLGVRGAAVTIDARALSAAGMMADYLIRESTSAPFTLRLLPGTHVVADAAGTGAVNFTVNSSGAVAYAPALQGILTGQGTSTLVVHGAAVTIDARALSAAGVMADYLIRESTSAPFTLRLLPGTHVLADAAGTGAVNFTVNSSGAVAYAPALQGILTVQGTGTLVVRGAAVTIDATALGATSVLVDYTIRESTSAPFTLRLLPGTHVVADAWGHAIVFVVNPDGTIRYDPALAGKLLGQGTTTLTIKSFS